MDERLILSREIVQQAIAEFKPDHIFGMFSGGHDSYCATHFISQHPQFSAAVHVNTGIGIEQTREFVRARCQAHGWRLLEYKAVENRNSKGNPDPQNYDDIVLQYGFPGPGQHTLMYARLKERCIRQLHRDHQKVVMLVTGVRALESARRMGFAQPIQKQGNKIWAAPIIDWSHDDIAEYMQKNNLPRNEVVDLLHMSGECLCGAFAKSGELDLLKIFFPDEARRIMDLQEQVLDAGFYWGWEDRPPEWHLEIKNGQQSLFDFLPLCVGCQMRHSEAA